MDKWHSRFLDVAQNHVSTWSKDPSRKIGAVAVDPVSRTILSTGYNGFPKGILDSQERLNDRPTKYKFIVHAEMNLIYNAANNGTKLHGSDIYVYGLPVCSECAKAIISVGIRRVFIRLNGEIPDHWKESFVFTQEMFHEAGIDVIIEQ